MMTMSVTASPPANWKQLANAANLYVPPEFTGVVLNCHEGKVPNVSVRHTANAKDIREDAR
jgi:hypothetical protein